MNEETSALLTSLQAMFPQLPLNTIQSAVQGAKSNDEAINMLLEIQTKQEGASNAPATNTQPLKQDNIQTASTIVEPVKEDKQRARGRSVVNRAEGLKRALSELTDRELRHWSTSELLELNHLLATTSLLVTTQMQSRLGIKPPHDENESINSSTSLNGSASHVHTPLLGSNSNSPRVRRRNDSVNSMPRDTTQPRDGNDDEWVVMEGQSRDTGAARVESSTLKSTLQKLTACSVKGCTNLGNESCPRCRARFCRDHASLLMTSTHVTRGQVLCLTCCDDMVQKIGVTRTHTGLYLTLRHNLNGTANEFVQTHRDKMQPRIKELASKPFNPIDSLTSMLPFNNLILTNKDTWTTCSQCGAYFDRLSLKRPCRICPQVFCGRCDSQLQVRTFNVKEVFSELPSRVIEEEPQMALNSLLEMNSDTCLVQVCAKCKRVIDKVRRKNKWHVIQEQFEAKPVVQICSNKFDKYLKLKAESQRDLDEDAKKHLVGDARALAEELQTLLIDQAKVLTQAELLLFARLRQGVMLFIAQLRDDRTMDDWNVILPNKEKIMTMSVPIPVSREEVMTSSPSPKNSLARMHSSIVLGEKDATSAKTGLTRVSSVVLTPKNSTSPPHSPPHDEDKFE